MVQSYLEVHFKELEKVWETELHEKFVLNASSLGKCMSHACFFHYLDVNLLNVRFIGSN